MKQTFNNFTISSYLVYWYHLIPILLTLLLLIVINKFGIEQSTPLLLINNASAVTFQLNLQENGILIVAFFTVIKES